MSEKSSQPLAAHPGTVTKPTTPLPVAAGASNNPPVPPAVSVAPALFGGHRGGGKKRGDGLVAGSPEAKAADLAADARRKRGERAAKKGAALPPPLPGVAASSTGAGVPLVAGQPAVPGVVAGVAGVALNRLNVAGVAPMFVPWSTRVLEKPARLLTKIIDRVRVWSLTNKIRTLELDPKDEKEILADLAWKESAVADFNAALAEAATVELNKRTVPGAANSHWLALIMSSGELLHAHTEALNRIESLVLKKTEMFDRALALAKSSPKN